MRSVLAQPTALDVRLSVVRGAPPKPEFEATDITVTKANAQQKLGTTYT